MSETMSDFNQYILDNIKFSINTKQLNEHLKQLNNANVLKDKTLLSLNELEKQIEYNTDKFNQLMNELSALDSKIQMLLVELHQLQMIEESNNDAKKVIDDAINTSHNEILIESAKENTYGSNLIETRLGFKLKLVQSDDRANCHLWIANFIFDAVEKESNQYVVIQVDTAESKFKLHDMKPKPNRFTGMVEFLDQTNDITGFMYNCKKFFNSFSK